MHQPASPFARVRPAGRSKRTAMPRPGFRAARVQARAWRSPDAPRVPAASGRRAAVRAAAPGHRAVRRVRQAASHCPMDLAPQACVLRRQAAGENRSGGRIGMWTGARASGFRPAALRRACLRRRVSTPAPSATRRPPSVPARSASSSCRLRDPNRPIFVRTAESVLNPARRIASCKAMTLAALRTRRKP